ncbi:hypothetical protein ACLOJK_004118 [Asimina triloba]
MPGQLSSHGSQDGPQLSNSDSKARLLILEVGVALGSGNCIGINKEKTRRGRPDAKGSSMEEEIQEKTHQGKN